jgi:hypothetical protein
LREKQNPMANFDDDSILCVAVFFLEKPAGKPVDRVAVPLGFDLGRRAAIDFGAELE